MSFVIARQATAKRTPSHPIVCIHSLLDGSERAKDDTHGKHAATPWSTLLFLEPGQTLELERKELHFQVGRLLCFLRLNDLDSSLKISPHVLQVWVKFVQRNGRFLSLHRPSTPFTHESEVKTLTCVSFLPNRLRISASSFEVALRPRARSNRF